jgi:hypothetical protein
MSGWVFVLVSNGPTVNWQCDTAGSARRTASRDPRGSRSQVRTGSQPATTSPAADRVFEVCKLFHPSYNDLAGRNGSRHCRDATMLRDNLVGLIEPMLSSAGANPLALRTATKKPSDDRPPCLENPRPEGAELTLTENALLHFTLSQNSLFLTARADRATKLGFAHYKKFP